LVIRDIFEKPNKHKTMKGKKTINYLIAVAIILFASCGGSQQQGDGNSSGKASKQSNLPNDPCELVYHVISTLNKGPETFEAAILNVNDFRQLKKNYPDLVKHYELWVKHHHSTNSYHFDFPLSLAFQMEFLERMAEEKDINFGELFNQATKDYYSMIRETAIHQQWIWDEIRLNDCMHRTESYPKVDLVRISHEDGSYEDIDEDQYNLPEIGETKAYIIINGEITLWEFVTVKTRQGWKIFYPILHHIWDEMEYEQ
jgi:hypothetical protein